MATWVSGCAVHSKPVSFLTSEKPEVLFCGDAMPGTLGIAPVRDSRPAEERLGKKPAGMFLLLWNQRKGDYLTSDKDFLDPVLSTIAERLGYAISRTNCFYETRVLSSKISSQPSQEELLIFLAKEKVDYVLTAELKHFYGRQSQNAHFFALPLYYVDVLGARNDVGVAQGFTEFIFTLYNTRTGFEVWRDKVMADSDSAVVGAYPDVARDSFLGASKKVANELYRFAQMQQGSAIFQGPEKQ